MEMNSQCPVMGNVNPATARHTAAGALSNRDWWPNQLNLGILHQNPASGNPLGPDFDYAKAFASLNLDEVKKDIETTLSTSQDFWPAGKFQPRWQSILKR